jgi:uncharacterized protein involved in copper resistance
MRWKTWGGLAAASLGLAACIAAAPVELGADHPANQSASSGVVDLPTALTDYKSAADFTARAAEDAGAMAGGHAAHGGMPGMQHHAMPGMMQGGAPSGATPP